MEFFILSISIKKGYILILKGRKVKKKLPLIQTNDIKGRIEKLYIIMLNSFELKTVSFIFFF